MRQPARSSAGAATSYLRFAIIPALPAFTALLLLSQEQPIPAEPGFLYKTGKPYRITDEPSTELQIREENRGSGGVGKVARGKHWQFPAIFTGAITPEAVWAIFKPASLANGWTAVHEWSAGGIELFLQYLNDGIEAWAETDPSPERTSVDVVEVAPIPFMFTLKPPAATPEPVNATADDFHWLGPLPGWRFAGSDCGMHSVMGFGF
jgi:hypothetical protein